MINWIRFTLFISLVSCVLCIQTKPVNAAQGEAWLHDASGYARALKLHQESKVPLVVYFYTDWCPYCNDLDSEYLTHPAVEAYLRGVVKVRINPEHGPAERAIANGFGVTGYPRFYVIRNLSSPLKNLQPFRKGGKTLTPEQFAMACQQAAPVSEQNRVSSAPSVMMNVTPPTGRNSTRGTKSELAPGRAATPGVVTDAKLPSLDTVLQKYVDAIGGKDAQLKLTSRVIKGKVDLAGVSRGGKIEIFTKAPNKSLTVMDVAPLGVIRQGFDGRSGWYTSKTTGMRTMTGAELAALAADADFYRDLKLKEMYATIKLLGKTKSGFRELYLVQAVPRGGNADHFYFDVESGLLFRRDTTRQTSAGMVRAEIYYGDWREVDGIRLPFNITQSMGKVSFDFTIEEVKHNVPLEEAVFRRP